MISNPIKNAFYKKSFALSILPPIEQIKRTKLLYIASLDAPDNIAIIFEPFLTCNHNKSFILGTFVGASLDGGYADQGVGLVVDFEGIVEFYVLVEDFYKAVLFDYALEVDL